MENLSTPLAISFLAGFAVFGVVSLTSFVKVTVVFMIIRQALGLQQVPSNTILMALAVFISVYISMPVFSDAIQRVGEVDADMSTVEGLISLFTAGIVPFQSFISVNTDPNHIDFFVLMSNDLWEGSGFFGTKDMFIIQVPAFMISELTEAFRIGFLLYLPFVAIDLAVTAILMALGMQMVQPTILATPFKLLTFVFVDGWARLVEGLVMTY